MKKILAGCLVVAVIAMIGLGVAMFYAYRMARPMIDSAAGFVAAANEIARLRDHVANKSDYTPPAGGELTPAQVDRFMAVQARVSDALKTRWAEIEAKSEELRKHSAQGHQSEPGHKDVTLSELRDMLSSIGSIWIEGRRVQVNALNIHKFSDDEYSWVRLRVWEAAGMELAGSIDMSAIEDLARQGAGQANVELPEVPPAQVPEANIRLVKPHMAKLKAWMPMAVFGL
jgi:hypothetical protein